MFGTFSSTHSRSRTSFDSHQWKTKWPFKAISYRADNATRLLHNSLHLNWSQNKLQIHDSFLIN